MIGSAAVPLIEVVDGGLLTTVQDAGRPGAASAEQCRALQRARNRGLAHLPAIAIEESHGDPLYEKKALTYLRDNLKYGLGEAEQAGLRRFYELAAEAVVHLAHQPLALATEDLPSLELLVALELARELVLALAHALLERLVQRARLAQGAHAFDVRATDAAGNEEGARALTLRLDAAPPQITGLPADCALWPPDHQLVQVGVVSASDAASCCSLAWS